MKEKISNLIDVKSIVTIALTILFIILSIKGVIDSNDGVVGKLTFAKLFE